MSGLPFDLSPEAERAAGDSDRPPLSAGSLPYHLTDLGNAERIVAQHGHGVRYCPPRKRWLWWDGKRWQWDETGTIPRLAKLSARSILREAAHVDNDDARKAIVKHAFASEAAARIRAAIDLAQSEPGIAVLPRELDSSPMLFNCANGTLDLETGRLRQHDRRDYITKMSPVHFDPLATSELWTSFLHEVTGGDAEFEGYLRRFAGYSLTGLSRERKFFLLQGPKYTNKSTFVDALSVVWGDYHMTADFDSWLVQSHTGGNRGDMVRLAGSRLVSSVETRKGARFDETLMKRITGGDELTYAAKFEAEVTFRATFKLLLAANDPPRVRDDDDPMWSRVALLPFTRVIAAPDPRIKARLSDPVETGPAILAWAARGCAEWQREGLGQANQVSAATADYRAEQDPLRDFFAEACEFSDDAKVTRKALRASYDEYCKENGIRYPIGARDFNLRIAERAKPCSVRDGSESAFPMKGWHGIRVKRTIEREEQP